MYVCGVPSCGVKRCEEKYALQRPQSACAWIAIMSWIVGGH